MTKEEFERMLSRENKWSNWLNRISLLSIFFIGVIFTYMMIAAPEEYPIPPTIFASCFLFTVVVYGIWRIPKQYEVTVISSPMPVIEKRAVAKQYIEIAGAAFVENSADLYRVTYTTVHWSRITWDYFQLNIHLNQAELMINVRQTSGRDGFIDMGNSHRETKKAIAFFTQHLQSNS